MRSCARPRPGLNLGDGLGLGVAVAVGVAVGVIVGVAVGVVVGLTVGVAVCVALGVLRRPCRNLPVRLLRFGFMTENLTLNDRFVCSEIVFHASFLVLRTEF